MKEKELIKRVWHFSNLLAKKYRLKKIYLFGSLAEGSFLKGSDVDIAIEGMGFEDYLKALAEHRQIRNTHLDILHLDFCKPQIRDDIFKKGKVLYEKE